MSWLDAYKGQKITATDGRKVQIEMLQSGSCLVDKYTWILDVWEYIK